ncbi:MAG: methyltransferase domain-containing protein [Candidatus Hydrogenedentes bacterium]|nr:methyltransferase domain-containing protein [Candidatus Hydrogenedentota bacterium]
MGAFTVRSILCFCLLATATTTAAEEGHDHGRKPSNVMSFEGADWLERPERVEEERPDEVIAAMELKPTDVVADIGAGSGFFTRRIAKVVTEGKVLAVDIQPEMNAILEEKCAAEGIKNVEIILGEEADPKLPSESADWMILADVYHEFQDPQPMLAKMLQALKSTGKVALLEYRLEGESAAHILKAHRMSVKQVLAEWNAAGFELIDLQEFLPSQHLFVFHKRPARGAN